MDENKTDNELKHWFSTYGLITSERILGRYHIHLPQDELIAAVKSPTSFYHQIVQVPLKHVLNGIILQQANDYHVYVQKLFIDYLISGESGKDAEAQGALTRESIEDERKQLLVLGDEFQQLQEEHEALISKSQAAFIKIAKEWTEAFDQGFKGLDLTLKNKALESKKSMLRKGMNHALIHFDLRESLDGHAFVEHINEVIEIPLNDALKEELSKKLGQLLEVTSTFYETINTFTTQTDELLERARSFRTQFYETILRVTELIKLLPDYKIDAEQDAINREPLYFDKNIGEK